MKRGWVFVGILLMGVGSLSGADKPSILPGLWEVTVTTELPVRSAPMTVTACITKDDLEGFKAPKSKAADDCQVTGGGTSGNLLGYSIKCAKKKVSSSTSFTFSPDRYEGVVIVTAPDHELRQVYSARRLGACDDPEFSKP